ncbi:MAG: branched-chain amino acid ABC transporter permease [Rhodobacterales bacterium]|nr:branched-chain amino acid ABC transporter permease [Rhodobacterales bacterium]
MRIVFKTSYDSDIRMFKHGWHAFWYMALLALAIALPFLVGEFWLGEFTSMLIWSVAGMGLMLLVGHTGLASLGHAAFLAVGAYANVLLQQKLGLPFLVSLPLAGVIAGLVGMLIAIPTTKLHGIYMAIATMAISILTEDIIVILEPWTGGVAGVFPPDIEIFGYGFNRYLNITGMYWLYLGITVLIVLAYKNILRSPLGRSFGAVRDSEISAQAMGINLPRTRTLAFALSCAITGIAGAMMGHFSGIFNNETFNIVISITLLLMIVVGGIGFIQGAFIGAFIITFLPLGISFGRDAIVSIMGGGGMAIPGLESGLFGAIVIAVIIFEPAGLYGRWLKIRTYFELFPFYRRDMFKRQKSYLKTERMR